MTNIYHATPYDICLASSSASQTASGFYFSDYEDYLEKASTHKNEYGDPVEEYEIQFIDGDNSELFKALSVDQANLKQWFDEFEELDGEDLIKAIFLAQDFHCHMDDILDKLDDVYLFEGTAFEYAENYIEESGMLDNLPEHLRYYFDTHAFARDMMMEGYLSELSIDGTTYIVEAHC